MERLLKTLRYNFLTEALDFVGVHQERILQVCHKLPLCFTWLLCSSSSGNESERAETLKVTPASGRVTVGITVRGGWNVIPSVTYLSVIMALIRFSLLPSA